MTSPMEAKRAELLADLAAHTAAVLQEIGIAGDLADHAGAALADYLADHWGGQVVSIPKDYYYRLSERERTILSAFSGNNFAELAKAYSITERGLRKLINRAIVRQRDLLQGNLFE